jgi:hypothetical protein
MKFPEYIDQGEKDGNICPHVRHLMFAIGLSQNELQNRGNGYYAFVQKFPPSTIDWISDKTKIQRVRAVQSF